MFAKFAIILAFACLLNAQVAQYGAYNLGAIYSNIQSKSDNQTIGKDYKSERFGVTFGIKRGVAFDNILLGAWLDGNAGRENKNGLYGFSSGIQAGYKLLDSKIILLGGIGGGVQNLATKQSSEQFNIYGFASRAEIAFNIHKGYGFSVIYEHFFDQKASKISGARFSQDRIIFAFSYYDFEL